MIKVKKFAIGALALVFTGAMCAKGDMYILGGSDNDSNVGSSSEPVDWSTSANWTPEGVPGAADEINWAPSKTGSHRQAYLSLAGDYMVGSLTTMYRSLCLYKGGLADSVSLTFATQLGGDGYQKHEINDGVRLVMADGSVFLCSRGDHEWAGLTIYSGGEADIYGAVESRVMKLTVSGGKLVFAPKSYGAASWGRDKDDHDEINISAGELSFPSGISMSGSYTVSNQLNQTGGEVTFGGSFSSATPWVYNFSGGALRITDIVSFGENIAVTVPDNAAITLHIASGAAISFGSVSYGLGAQMTKTGSGDFAFDPYNMPAALAMNEGGLVLGSAGASYDFSGVTFAANTNIKIGATGIELSNCSSTISAATFEASGDFAPAAGATVLTCADPTVLARAKTGLNASLAGTGVTVEISGNSLVAESHFTFSSTTITDLNDADGWVNGLAAAEGQSATISGAGTDAVMDYRVPAYATISVEDGASLTVAATRGLPATTLAAGTALNVASETIRVVMESQAHEDYVMNVATLVGTMSPSRSISEITDIAGNIGGGWLGNKDRLYTYVNTKVLDDGAKLRAQFIYNDSDYTKCAFVEFTKDDHGNIYATGVGAGYISPTAEQVDFDEIEYQSAPYGTSDTSGAYGVKKLSFKAPVVYGGPSTVAVVGDLSTTDSGSVTVDVAEDCVLDLSGADMTTEATLVKTGTGTIVFGDELPTALNISAGLLVLRPYVEYDMSTVTLGSGVEVKVILEGEYKSCIATPGPNGTTVYMTGFTYVGVGGWGTLSNWAGGSLPDESSTVRIYGASTVLTLDALPATMPASIIVEGGAKLSVATDVNLPTMTLGKEATLEIASGTVSIANGLVGIVLADGDDVTIPALVVLPEATLMVPGGMNFSNVDISLYGMLSASSDGTLTFGYAPAGETTYIGLYAEGAKIRLRGDSGYDARRIGICCPEFGGHVVAVRNIIFKDMPTVGTHFPSYDYPDGFYLGYDNPDDEAFEVVFDNSAWGVDGNLYVCGGAVFRLTNGSSFQNSEEYGYYNRHAGVKDNGCIVVERDCELRLNAMGNGGAIPFDVTVGEVGHEAVIVEDGGVFESFRWSGNDKGVFASSNGVIRIYNPRYDDDEHNWHNVNGLFDNLSAVSLATNSVLTFTTRNGSSSKGFKDNSGPRVVAMADVPITGGGSIALDNANVNAFGVVVQSGANTATGTASVIAPTGSEGATTLYFADGANWAGTVVAGNVALTNLTDSAAAANVNFRTLDLAADFPVRVWKEGGVVVTNDMLNVVTYGGSTGRLVLMPAPGSEELSADDRIVVGKISKSSPVPTGARGWSARTSDILGDDANYLLTLKPNSGMQIILR